MFRRDLIDILEERPISLHDLASLLEQRPQNREDDLQHVFRSLRKDPLYPVITPAHCRKCGFQFDDGGIYLWRQDAIGEHWELVLYDSRRREETRLSST